MDPEDQFAKLAQEARNLLIEAAKAYERGQPSEGESYLTAAGERLFKLFPHLEREYDGRITLGTDPQKANPDLYIGGLMFILDNHFPHFLLGKYRPAESKIFSADALPRQVPTYSAGGGQSEQIGIRAAVSKGLQKAKELLSQRVPNRRNGRGTKT
jgi:hypothetical protein